MPKLERIIETALYCDDLAGAKRFYETVLGLERIFEAPTLSAYSVGGQNVLLLFERGASLKVQHLAGGGGAPEGEIPPHDGAGPLHICFAVGADDLADWEARLGEHAVPVTGRVRWRRGGRSLYFSDPEGHLVELMTPGNWPGF